MSSLLSGKLANPSWPSVAPVIAVPFGINFASVMANSPRKY